MSIRLINQITFIVEITIAEKLSLCQLYPFKWQSCSAPFLIGFEGTCRPMTYLKLLKLHRNKLRSRES